MPTANSNPAAPRPQTWNTKKPNKARHPRALRAQTDTERARHAMSESPRVAGALGGPSPGAPCLPTGQPDQTLVLAPAGARAPSPLLLARANPRRGRRPSPLSPTITTPPPTRTPPLVERVVPPRALRLRPLYPATKNYPKKKKKTPNPRDLSVIQYRATYQSDC
jgi:hypothetical protein